MNLERSGRQLWVCKVEVQCRCSRNFLSSIPSLTKGKEIKKIRHTTKLKKIRKRNVSPRGKGIGMFMYVKKEQRIAELDGKKEKAKAKGEYMRERAKKNISYDRMCVLGHSLYKVARYAFFSPPKKIYIFLHFLSQV